MLTLQLYKTLSKHQELSEKRNPLMNQGNVARVIGYIVIAISAIYLISFSIMFAFIVNEGNEVAYEFMYAFVPFFFHIDFYIRFAFQQTPTQQVKPYVLLPISRYSCIDFFVIRQLISPKNFIWMLLYVPYTIMTMVFSDGIITTLLFLFGLYIIELIISQTYSIVRSKINQNMIWWVLLIPLSLAIFSPFILNTESSFDKRFSMLIYFYSEVGAWLSEGNIIAWIVLFSILIFFTFLNRKLQFSLVYDELSGKESTITTNVEKGVSSNHRWGMIGRFIHIEYLSVRRNKNVRKMFISTNVIVLLFSVLCSFTSVYDEMFGTMFWCIYCFAIYGTRMLLSTMSYEGNYIEALMMGQQTIEKLLKAKYYLYSFMLIIPFILLLPMVIMGKQELYTLISLLLYTAGVDHLVFLRMAIYNKQTMPLNEKFSGKVKIENNWIVVMIEILSFFLPVIIIKINSLFADDIVALFILAIMGIGFIATHNYWISSIYKKLYARKYDLMESMIKTR